MTRHRPRHPGPAEGDPTTELEELRARLREAEETLQAIRLGEADAVVVQHPEGASVYTLVTADQSYRTLIEQMREAAFILSEEGTVLYDNGRLGTVAAGSSLAGWPLSELAVPSDRPAVRDLLEHGSEGEAVGEVRFVGENDAPVPVRLSISALRTGGFAGLAAIVTDLSEQKRRERAAERERLADAVLEFAGTAILVCDAGGGIVRANRAALELCGEGAVGCPFEEVLPIGIAYEELREGEPEEPREVTLRSRSGETRFLLVSARRIGDAAPDDDWWVVTLTDLTERRQIEDALRRARDAADAANRSKSDFLSVMSHELRTPLNSVLGYADLLLMELQGPLNDSQMGQIERIRASARHQLSLIEEILAYARIEAGHEDLSLDRVDISGLVRDVAELVRPEADRKGIDFTLDLPDVEDLEVVTDAGKLRRILINLTANATKFTEKGGVRIAAGRGEDGRLALSVRDTGPGIPDDHLEKMWEPFTQLDPSVTRESGGTGLGLAIVRRLTGFMRGEIDVSTELGRGTTFTVRLPDDSADAAAG